MRLPRFDDRRCLADRPRTPPGIVSVSQRQIDDIRERRFADDRQDARRAGVLGLGGCGVRILRHDARWYSVRGRQSASLRCADIEATSRAVTGQLVGLRARRPRSKRPAHSVLVVEAVSGSGSTFQSPIARSKEAFAWETI